jgi:hypothetical protein
MESIKPGEIFMKYLIAIILSCVFSFGQAAAAEEKKDIIGYAGLYWRMTLEDAKEKCGPYFAVGKESDYYFCDRIKEFQGIDFSRGFGVAKKADLFMPPIKETILRFISSQLYEVEIPFEGKIDKNQLKTRDNLLNTYKAYLNILVLEFGAPSKSAKPGEISFYQRLDIWSTPSGCMMLQVMNDKPEGVLKLLYKEKCGSL